MRSPPLVPEVSPELLALCARYDFHPVGSQAMGIFRDTEGRERPLLLTALSPRIAWGAAWMLEGHAACMPFIFDRLTYHVLHEGVAEREAIVWQGRQYQIAAAWDGLRPVAVAMLFTPREPGEDPAP